MKTTLFAILGLVALSVSAVGQTRISGAQLAVPCAGTSPQVLVVVPGPAGITFQCVPITSAPVYTEIWNESVTATAPVLSLTLKNGGSITALRLHRNGLRLTPTVDYTLAGNVITFLTAATPQQGDVLTCDYRFQ